MKKRTRKLELNRETLRLLVDRQLQEDVAGGTILTCDTCQPSLPEGGMTCGPCAYTVDCGGGGPTP